MCGEGNSFAIGERSGTHSKMIPALLPTFRLIDASPKTDYCSGLVPAAR